MASLQVIGGGLFFLLLIDQFSIFVRVSLSFMLQHCIFAPINQFMKTKTLRQDKVNVVTLGCSKNLVDSENLITQLKANDYEVMHDSNDDANIIIINTCGFIDLAKEESINTIVQYAEIKANGGIDKLYVTGCLSQRYKDDLEKEKRMYTGIWAKREKQIERVINNTIGMHGDLQGLMGASLPQITGLTIEETEYEIDDVKVTNTKTTVMTDNFTQTSLEDLL